MSKMRPRASLVPLLLVFIALPVIAQAPYPARNVQIIVPYTAGGSIDIMTRAVAQQLTVAWGKNVVVDNRPGASGMIGTEAVSRARCEKRATTPSPASTRSAFWSSRLRSSS